MQNITFYAPYFQSFNMKKVGKDHDKRWWKTGEVALIILSSALLWNSERSRPFKTGLSSIVCVTV